MFFMLQEVGTVTLLRLPLTLLRRLLSCLFWCLPGHPVYDLPSRLHAAPVEVIFTPSLVFAIRHTTCLTSSHSCHFTPLFCCCTQAWSDRYCFFPCTRHDGAHLIPRSWCLVNEHHLSSADDDTCSIPHLGAEKTCRDYGARVTKQTGVALHCHFVVVRWG